MTVGSTRGWSVGGTDVANTPMVPKALISPVSGPWFATVLKKVSRAIPLVLPPGFLEPS